MRKSRFDTKHGPVHFEVNEETNQIEVSCSPKGWHKKVVCTLGHFDGVPVDPTKVKNLEEFCKGWFKLRLGVEKSLKP